MSRRTNNNQASQNQQVISSLLKLDGNKICADCKRNKHPRWASWSIGVFICIRCSGVHRGMGTHISRVKSIDLDSWSDEQLQNMLKWGNTRANKYWEAKLAPGHIPSEAKIENFIRTKYEARRWVMEGPVPDPSTLEDEDVPLAVVQENVKIERSASQRVAAARQSAAAAHRHQPSIDFFDDEVSPPARPSTTGPVSRAALSAGQPAVSKPNKTGDSLLGLDFFGDTNASSSSHSASSMPIPSNPSGVSRPDLKQSILSLYAKPPPGPPQHNRKTSFGNTASQPYQQSSLSPKMGGLTDAFSGLSFPSAAPLEKPSPFANLTSFANKKSPPAAPKISSPTVSANVGNLLDSNTTTTGPSSRQSRTTSTSSINYGQNLTSFTSPASQAERRSISFMNDLANLPSSQLAPAASPMPTAVLQQKPPVASPQHELKSAFNLSNPAPTLQSAQSGYKASVATATTVSSQQGMLSSSFGPFESNAWGASEPAAAQSTASSMMRIPDTLTPNDIGARWGGTSPSASKPPDTVTADEDFGGWASAVPVSPTKASSAAAAGTTAMGGMQPKSSGFGGADDLFSNVWQ